MGGKIATKCYNSCLTESTFFLNKMRTAHSSQLAIRNSVEARVVDASVSAIAVAVAIAVATVSLPLSS